MYRNIIGTALSSFSLSLSLLVSWSRSRSDLVAQGSHVVFYLLSVVARSVSLAVQKRKRRMRERIKFMASGLKVCRLNKEGERERETKKREERSMVRISITYCGA